MKDNVEFSKNGVTSWGCPWEWTFGSPIALKSPNGFTLLTTDFHTLELEYNFEDSKFDPAFSLSLEQDAEWDQICWDCFHQEFTIYGMVQKGFRSCAVQLINDYLISHDVTLPSIWIPKEDVKEMHSACLEVIRTKWGWGGQDKEQFFNTDGTINRAVYFWFLEELEETGHRVE